jgi:hypothetical protein
VACNALLRSVVLQQWPYPPLEPLLTPAVQARHRHTITTTTSSFRCCGCCHWPPGRPCWATCCTCCSSRPPRTRSTRSRSASVIAYAVDLFNSSCPPESKDAFLRCANWVHECQDVTLNATLWQMTDRTHHLSAVRAMQGLGVYQDLHARCTPQHLTVLYDPQCATFLLLLHQHELYMPSLLLATLLVFAWLAWLGPRRLHSIYRQKREFKEAGDRKRNEDPQRLAVLRAC